MRNRTLAALILTPPITGMMYAIVGAMASRSVSADYRTGQTADFVVGCICGLVFEILILLPLASVAGKRSWPRTALFLAGCCIWFAASLGLFSLFFVGSDAVIAGALQMLLPGVVLCAAFTLLFVEPTRT